MRGSISLGNRAALQSLFKGDPMKHLMTVLALSVACLSAPAFAADVKPTSDPSKPAASAAPMGKQQTRMGECNAEAGDKKGPERKTFMKSCLTAKKTQQQEKMKTCNAEAKAKAVKGAERKAMMKECLSK
jgi:hypothetical protein